APSHAPCPDRSHVMTLPQHVLDPGSLATRDAHAGSPCAMVIFGASGDLTKRKLIPALYNLARENLLSRDFALVGFARQELTTDDFREKCTREVAQFVQGGIDGDLWQWLCRRMYYVRGDFGDEGGFQRLRDALQGTDAEHGTRGNYLYYLATAPSAFSTCVHQVSRAGLIQETNGAWRRVIIEKPFGRDFDSARALNRDIQSIL